MLDELKKPFDTNLISWRVGATNVKKDGTFAWGDKPMGIPLAYIDARDVMERLDEVCGAKRWQNRYPMKGCCEIGIHIHGEWVWKTNGAGETQVEADKGQYSDAFKRAAVLWGVGRYLYDVENKWVELSGYGRSYKIKNPHSSELKEMLANAAKGIRVAPGIPDEPEQEITGDRMKKFIDAAEKAIKEKDNMDALNTWHRANQEAITRLDDFPALKVKFEKGYSAHLSKIMNSQRMAAE